MSGFACDQLLSACACASVGAPHGVTGCACRPSTACPRRCRAVVDRVHRRAAGRSGACPSSGCGPALPPVLCSRGRGFPPTCRDGGARVSGTLRSSLDGSLSTAHQLPDPASRDRSCTPANRRCGPSCCLCPGTEARRCCSGSAVVGMLSSGSAFCRAYDVRVRPRRLLTRCLTRRRAGARMRLAKPSIIEAAQRAIQVSLIRVNLLRTRRRY